MSRFNNATSHTCQHSCVI